MARKRKTSKEECPIRIVDAEERRQIMTKSGTRGAFLNRLESVVNEPAFSVKNIRKKESNLGKKEEKKEKDDDLYLGRDDVGGFGGFIDDDQWGQMMDAFDEIDPLDDITGNEKFSYRGKKGKSSFEEKFAQEYSLTHSLLSNLQKQSKIVNKQLEAMGLGGGKKGTPGVGKFTVDLLNASVSLQGNQLHAIKELVNIKKTIADLEAKDLKNNPKEEETTDTSASRFYDHIIGGGRQNFIEAVKGSIQTDSDNDEVQEGGVSNRMGFNISQPLPVHYGYDEEEEDKSYDKYNYINREHDNVSVCIQRFSDGDFSFVALDEDGEEVLDYELPDHVTLGTIKFSPTSNIATDKFGRKYRIVDIDTDSETY